MRPLTAVLALVSLLLVLPPAFAKKDPCQGLEKAAEYLDTKQLRKEYREHYERGLGDPVVEIGSIEKARNYVQNLPAFKDYGFDIADYTKWKKYSVRMEKSSFKDKFTGWETKTESGNYARYRLDYEPDGLGLHYNIELRGKDPSGKVEKLKLAVKVLCEGKTCSESQALKYIETMNR